MKKSLCILGSTGSIGVQSLDVARNMGYEVSALTANNNVSILEKQIREWRPRYAALFDNNAAKELKIKVADTDTIVLSGTEGICQCAAENNSDTVINAIVGLAGLLPTMAAISSKKTLALANKETLVAGGELVTNAARENNVPILPIDSEHSAIFQCLCGRPSNKALKKIILTASGGPFFGYTEERLREVTAAQALRHPNWEMGAKITIDSATMFNKGLELIEAVRLFDVDESMVDIVVHRESIIHSLVEYDDNSVIAQLGLPDMRIPIQFALTYPERYPSPVEELNLARCGSLSFFEPDYSVFDCLNICREAIKKGGLQPAAVNSANEEANLLFRQEKIKFLQIAEIIRQAVEDIPDAAQFSIEDILAVDKEVRQRVISASERI